METGDARDFMEIIRRVWATGAGAVTALALVRVVSWLTGLDGTALLVLAALAGIAGGVAGHRGARQLTPLTGGERRDAVIGWGIVGLLVAVVAVGASLEAAA